MTLNFQIIPHCKQRYKTCGDWFPRRGVMLFRVSRMKDKRYCWLIFLHEVIEWAICRLTGVKAKDVDRFDKQYEASRSAKRAPCGCLHEDEPGDDVHAPYCDAHQVATYCEREIARSLGVSWAIYTAEVESL